MKTDPAALVEQLDPEAIRDRLHELGRQARALRVLLRAALTRQKDADRPRRPPAATKGVAGAQ
jgi:hypothetical protein